MANDKLTVKQRKFVDYYIQTDNATESYKLAGYRAKNDNVAGVSAHRLLKDPKVAQAIEDRTKELENDRIASATQVLEELTLIAMSDEASLKDRIRALELLGKKHGLFREKLEVEQNVDFEITLTGMDDDME